MLANTGLIDSALKVIDKYREELRFSLESNKLQRDDIEIILSSLQIYSGIYVSSNPRYRRSTQKFANFITGNNLPEQLGNSFSDLLKSGLYEHQVRAIHSILSKRNTIVSTGTGSGKTESFLIPIIAHCYQAQLPGVKALLIYPMNSLAQDQVRRIGKCTSGTEITFGLFTGATPQNEQFRKVQREYDNQLVYRDEIIANPPDILITNYVMLDRMLTRNRDQAIFVKSSKTLHFLVLDEIHIYGGTKGAHIKYLLARLKYYLQETPVHIGTSATLMTDGAGRQRLDHFASQLFGCSSNEYELITAEEELEEALETSPVPHIDPRLLESISFKGDTEAAQALAMLTGQRINKLDFYAPPEQFHEKHSYRCLAASTFVQRVKEALRQSAQSFDDLVDVMHQSTQDAGLTKTQLTALTKAYLQAIAFINFKGGPDAKPVLDYRLHIFLRDLSGYLKKCPRCDSYHSGDTEFCPHDGYILFAVYRENIRLCVGKVNGQALSPVLERESTDFADVHYVLLGRSEDMTSEEKRYAGELDKDGKFKMGDGGSYVLSQLKVYGAEEIRGSLVFLRDERHDYLYLQRLVKVLLQSHSKCLGFFDNRELASRSRSILRDELVSDFLEEFMRLAHPQGRDLSIPDSLMYLQKQASLLANTACEKEIFDELPLWFFRRISIPERLTLRTSNLLSFRSTVDLDSLSELECELLDLFLHERALDKEGAELNSDSRYILFQKYWAVGHFGIYTDSTHSSDPRYRGLSLNEHSRTHKAFVEQWTADAIQDAIEGLVGRDILVSRTSPDGKQAYYLRLAHIRLDITSSQYGDLDNGYAKLCRDLLFIAELHSSDIQPEVRKRLEDSFRKGEIHFVASTPTLEVGIDIGDLQTILMVGAPPSPASYIQRAGRAGRSNRSREALIITFCSPRNAHDRYAFDNPRAFINGIVTPPSTNAENNELVSKHINAFILREHLGGERELRYFLAHFNILYTSETETLRSLFGSAFPYQAYGPQLEGTVHEIMRALERGVKSASNYAYENGYFPDYNFSREQVVAVDQLNVSKLINDDMVDWKDYALTTRDLEQAITFFVPGQTLFVAGEVYRTLNDGRYDILPDGSRSYLCFYAEKEEYFAERRKEINRLDLLRELNISGTRLIDKGGVLQVGYARRCTLSFRNRGIKHAVPKENPYTPYGYDLQREAFVFRFNKDVCGETLRHSFVAAVARTIQHHHALADAELRLALDVKQATDDGIFGVLYDGTGNYNVPFDCVDSDFEAILRITFDRLHGCSCDSNGCYACIKSYALQGFDRTVSRAHALMFVAYLLGEGVFEPEISPFTPANRPPDLTLRVFEKGEAFIVRVNGREHTVNIESDYNTSLFNHLASVIHQERKPGMNVLKIETWVDWLANTINERSIGRGKQAFSNLQYAMLPFKQVIAVRFSD